jgi:membrane associated rhomboid family serine protease
MHMPAVIVLGCWIVLQFISQAGVPAGAGGGVAYWAHIGGFLAGMALILALARGKSTRGLESGWR